MPLLTSPTSAALPLWPVSALCRLQLVRCLPLLLLRWLGCMSDTPVKRPCSFSSASSVPGECSGCASSWQGVMVVVESPVPRNSCGVGTVHACRAWMVRACKLGRRRCQTQCRRCYRCGRRDSLCMGPCTCMHLPAASMSLPPGVPAAPCRPLLVVEKQKQNSPAIVLPAEAAA